MHFGLDGERREPALAECPLCADIMLSYCMQISMLTTALKDFIISILEVGKLRLREIKKVPTTKPLFRGRILTPWISYISLLLHKTLLRLLKKGLDNLLL